MKLELSYNQYKSLWSKYNIPTITISINQRIQFWNDNLKSKFNLEYTESNGDIVSIENEAVCADFGAVIGDEKYINWFLLNL